MEKNNVETESLGIICYTDRVNGVSGISIIESAKNFLDDPENFKAAIYDLIDALGSVNNLEGAAEAKRSVTINGTEFTSEWVQGVFIPVDDDSTEHILYIDKGNTFVPLKSLEELIAILVGVLGLDDKSDEEKQKFSLKIFIEILISVLTEKPFYTINSPSDKKSAVIAHIGNVRKVTGKLKNGDIESMTLDDLKVMPRTQTEEDASDASDDNDTDTNADTAKIIEFKKHDKRLLN